MILIVCGVSGTGKTTVGMQLAGALQLPFIDADDFHPPWNIAEMRSGVPLTDYDRKPWLDTLVAKTSEWHEDVLAERLASRPGRFFNRNLLGSQLDALEVPGYAMQVDVNARPGEIVKTILERLQVL